MTESREEHRCALNTWYWMTVNMWAKCDKDGRLPSTMEKPILRTFRVENKRPMHWTWLTWKAIEVFSGIHIFQYIWIVRMAPYWYGEVIILIVLHGMESLSCQARKWNPITHRYGIEVCYVSVNNEMKFCIEFPHLINQYSFNWNIWWRQELVWTICLKSHLHANRFSNSFRIITFIL